MRGLMLLLLGAILIAALSYFCFINKAGAIKDDLISSANSAYASKGMDWVKSGILGDGLEMTRVLTLTGTAPSEVLKDEASRVALSIEGVEGVDNNIVVKQVSSVQKPVKTTAPLPYKLDIIKDRAGKVRLSGYVPTFKVHTELINQAKMLFGSANIIDELKERDNAPDMWSESAKLGLDKLEVVEYGTLNMSNNRFYFEGFVVESEQKKALVDDFKVNLHSSYVGTYNIKAPIARPAVVKKEPKPALSCQEQFKDALSKEKIHFEYNRADIKGVSHKLLDNLAAIAKKCSAYTITIGGHTDSIGSANYNQALSQRRADAVRDYLVKKGVSANTLKAVGYGESQPIADNMVEEGRAKNRRIEFNVKGVK